MTTMRIEEQQRDAPDEQRSSDQRGPWERRRRPGHRGSATNTGPRQGAEEQQLDGATRAGAATNARPGRGGRGQGTEAAAQGREGAATNASPRRAARPGRIGGVVR
jgi:hypothetical protein